MYFADDRMPLVQQAVTDALARATAPMSTVAGSARSVRPTCGDDPPVTRADALVRMLQACACGICSPVRRHSYLPSIDARWPRLRDSGIDHVLTRDERSAAYMADQVRR
jgi:hypothetical protein